jgi:hypothetical protein
MTLQHAGSTTPIVCSQALAISKLRARRANANVAIDTTDFKQASLYAVWTYYALPASTSIARVMIVPITLTIAAARMTTKSTVLRAGGASQIRAGKAGS